MVDQTSFDPRQATRKNGVANQIGTKWVYKSSWAFQEYWGQNPVGLTQNMCLNDTCSIAFSSVQGDGNLHLNTKGNRSFISMAQPCKVISNNKTNPYISCRKWCRLREARNTAVTMRNHLVHGTAQSTV